MEQSKLDRINALAKKSKTEGLNDAEREEQQQLRKEYIAIIRKNMRGTLDNTIVQYPDGTRKHLRKS